MQQLEGAFGGAQVAACEADVRIDHPDKSKAGEVVALRHHLGADHHINLPRGDAVECGLGLGGSGKEIGCEHQLPRLGSYNFV